MGGAENPKKSKSKNIIAYDVNNSSALSDPTYLTIKNQNHMKTALMLLTSCALTFTALNTFSQNTTYGTGAGTSLTTGTQNSFFGYYAGAKTSTGNRNNAIGDSALYSNTSGINNTANGYIALMSNTSGSYNTATGYKAMYTCSTASFNVAFGGSALRDNTASNNSAVGYAALLNNVSGTGNTGLGEYAISTNTSGNYNTGVGNGALNYTSVDGGSALGYQALYNSTSGTGNTATGFQALYANTTGSLNIADGYRAGFTNTTGTGNTFVGYTADASAATYTNATAFGYGTVVNASNKVRLGNTTVTVVEGQVSYTTSDKRFKFNIQESVKGLEFIKKLRPVSYQFDTRKFDEFLIKNMPDSLREKRLNNIDYKPSTNIIHTGFLAQEVEQAAKDCHFVTDIVHIPADGNDNYSISYQAIVVPLVKAVQEQQSTIDSLKTQLAQLSQLIKAMSSMPRTGQADNAQAIQLGNADVVALGQNVPNPFSEQTIINYSIPQTAGSAQILFYDPSGVLIKTIDIKTKGKGQLTVFASDLSGGLYSYTLVIDGRISDTKKMVKQ